MSRADHDGVTLSGISVHAMANEVGLPVRAVVKLARRLGDRGVRDRSSLISPMVARQIRQEHTVRTTAALRKRRDLLAQIARSRQLSKAEQNEYRKLISVLGLPSASSLRPKRKKSGAGSAERHSQASGSETVPRKHRIPRDDLPIKPASSKPISSVTTASLAKELRLSTDYIAMLASRYGGGSDTRDLTVPGTVADVIRQECGVHETAAMRDRYELLRSQLGKNPRTRQGREFSELRFMFEGKVEHEKPRNRLTVTAKPRPQKRNAAPPRRVCKLCRKEFYSTEPSHGCALDKRTRKPTDLPPIKPVKSKRQRRPSVLGPEYDISPRRGSLEVPNGHPGTGRRR